MNIETRVLSCMEKVFLDDAPDINTLDYQGFQNETIDFQVAFRAMDARWEEVRVQLESELKSCVSIRQVKQVPVQYAMPDDAKEDCLRTAPGLYPDLLSPIGPHSLHISPRWTALWLRVKPSQKIKPGSYLIHISLYGSDGLAYPVSTVRVDILPGMLPPQKLIHTKWFHCDCLSQYYHTEVYSERHWQIIENFIRKAVDGGINMILMPVHTPPLDTRPGGERLTTQLVAITVDNGNYLFDMSLVRRWIALCKKCGVAYYEIAHLFTQWGAEHAPKIMATIDGEYKQIFGWDTDAAGDEYGRFLRAYIPALRACFQEEGIEENVYWHISDEPSQEQLASYAAARNQVIGLLSRCHIMDALSNLNFYCQGLVSTPIPANDAIAPFLEAGIKGLWTYYCCAQTRKVSNMFIALPSWRNRILGVQLFQYEIAGFLQWGYNFYNSHLSDQPINPYLTTDADGWVPAGDPFQVYPGSDGMPEESIRMAVTSQALQDLRALEMLSQRAGREAVLHLINEGLEKPITFSEYPRGAEYLLHLRQRVNKEILRFSNAV